MSPWLIDGRPLQAGSATRGIGTYLRGLLSGMIELGVGDRIALLMNRGGQPPFELSRWPVTLPSLGRRLQPVADPALIAAALLRRRPSLYHGVEYGQPLAAAVPVVITAHDLIPFLLPEIYPWMRRERLLGRWLLHRADAVIADSAATARDLERVAAVQPDRITVVHPGVSATFRRAPAEGVERVRRRLGLEGRYLLAVGTFDPRKRIELLATVMATVRRTLPLQLVLCGDQGAFEHRVMAALAASGVAEHTVLPGHVSESELVALYSGAACLVFTSAYEGFGLPVLEAMACRTVAVSFDNSALAEVAGDAAVLVPDGDADAMAQAVLSLLDDPGRLERLARAGEARAAGFSWRRTAEQTVEVYRSLVD